MPGQFKWEVTPGRWLLQVIYDFFKAPSGQFKWEVTPGRWLLQVIYDFFKAPSAHLADEKEKTWTSA
jgi:hypothetical protein